MDRDVVFEGWLCEAASLTFFQFFTDQPLRPWQVLLNVDGLCLELEDGDSVHGLDTMRQVVAFSRGEAERKAIERLRGERRFDAVLGMHRENAAVSHEPAIVAEKIYRISWWQYFFGSYARSFIFYPKDEDPSEGA
jgi:hypothetical protein